MTPQEKAIELVNQHSPFSLSVGNTSAKKAESRKENAKQSAIVTVDRVLMLPSLPLATICFWEEIKEEIQKLWLKDL